MMDEEPAAPKLITKNVVLSDGTYATQTVYSEAKVEREDSSISHIRKMILGGDVFLGSIIASSLTKIWLRASNMPESFDSVKLKEMTVKSLLVKCGIHPVSPKIEPVRRQGEDHPLLPRPARSKNQLHAQGHPPERGKENLFRIPVGPAGKRDLRGEKEGTRGAHLASRRSHPLPPTPLLHRAGRRPGSGRRRRPGARHGVLRGGEPPGQGVEPRV